MSDYMKEAERLADAYANTFFCEKSATEILEARAALLAHIQRGALDGWQVVPEIASDVMQRPFLAHTALQCADFDSRYAALLAAAPAPDQFRDAAKMVMMTVQPCAETFDVDFPARLGAEVPAPAEVPTPECYVTSGGRDLFSEEQMSTYGDAREAAGYARGLADERERCVSVAWAHYMDTCRRKGIGPDVLPDWCCAAALRGEVKGLVSTETECDLPPRGWRCTRGKGHSGPCAAVECPWEIEIVERAMKRLRGEVKP